MMEMLHIRLSAYVFCRTITFRISLAAPEITAVFPVLTSDKFLSAVRAFVPGRGRAFRHISFDIIDHLLDDRQLAPDEFIYCLCSTNLTSRITTYK